jgi:precorrin-6B methylase 2
MNTRICTFLLPLFGQILIGCAAPTSETAVESMEGAKTTHKGTPAVLFIEFVATPQDVVERMLEVAGVTKEDVICDLGCGDGRIVVTAARRYGCRAIGYDLDLLRVQEARQNAAEHGVAHLVTIKQKDVLKADLTDVSIVTLYMGTELNARLIPQLQRLRPGTRIVSHEFPLGNLTPDRVIRMTSRSDNRQHTIYLWTCPLAPKSP